MKTKLAFLFLLAVAAISSAVAQNREDDDMYFTSKDRAILNAALQKDRQEIFASSNVRRITESETASTINPTDSYSARNVNPEYVSGSKVGSSAIASTQYFSPNYQPTTVNQNLASNCASCGFNTFNNGFYSPFNRFGNPYRMGGMGMMGMGMSPWGYNSMSMMNPWMDPWLMNGMNGFYQPGLSFSFGMGSGWGNGWNSFNNPWDYNNWGMNSFYGGWGNSWGYNSFNNPYGYANNFLADNGHTYYGTRTSRSTNSPNYYNSNNGQIVTNGRSVATSGGASSTYYDRGWRQGVNSTTRSTWNNPGNSGGNDRGWNNSNNGSSNWGGRQNTWDNSNNSFNNGGGFNGGRSGGFGGGGGSSGGGGGRSSSSGGRGGRN